MVNTHLNCSAGAAEVSSQERGDGGRGNADRLLPRESAECCHKLAKGNRNKL